MTPLTSREDASTGRPVNSPRRIVGALLRRILPGSWFRALKAARACLAEERRIRRQEVVNSRTVAALTAARRPILLELGAGGRRMEGWTSIDWGEGNDLRLDLTKPLPFPDASVDGIYSSHTFEHFSYPHPMNDVLQECRRILKPGAWIKISVPDASIYLNGYCSGDFDVETWCVYKPGLDGLSRIDCANYMAYMNGEHKHLFDAENLVAVLQHAGFADGAIRDFDPALDLPERQFESLYAGGSKASG